MSLEGDYHEVEVTPNLELLVIFYMSLEGVCHELYVWNEVGPQLKICPQDCLSYSGPATMTCPIG
jgi:hypothetical protein